MKHDNVTPEVGNENTVVLSGDDIVLRVPV